MFLGRKSGKAVSERPSCPETGCGLDIGVWSMRPLLDSEPQERERERERRGREGHRTKTGSLYKFKSWPKVGPNLAPQDGQGFRIRPLV